MATYLQWSARKNLKRIAWVCGPEQVLQREVVAAYREAVPRDAVRVLYAGRAETALWDEVLTEPGLGAQLVIVRDADRLTFAENFRVLTEATSMGNSFVVFTSSEADFPRSPAGPKKRVLVPHLAVLQSSKDAQLIRCAAPSKEEDQVALVASWWPGSGGNFAHDLLKQVGGALDEAYEACGKARAAGLEPSQMSLELVAEKLPGSGYVDALLAGDCADAAMLAGKLTRDEVGSALSTLITKLDRIDVIRQARESGMERAEMVSKLRLDRFLLLQLWPVSQHYGSQRVRSCRELLALAQGHYRAGAFEGIPEAVAALW